MKNLWLLPLNNAGLAIRVCISLSILFFLPIMFYRSNSSWLAYSYTKEASIFEYFGFTGTLLVLLNLCFEYLARKRNNKPVNNLLLFSFVIVTSFHLILFSELSNKGFDYYAYEGSVRAVLEGQSIYHSEYASSHPYIYPPLLAQVLTFIYLVFNFIAEKFSSTLSGETFSFFYLFYFYQFSQFVLTIVTFFLTYKFARLLKLNNRSSILLISILTIINLPLYRNFSQNQVNLYILFFILISILSNEKYPYLSSITIAIGTLLKIYPIIALIPWFFAKMYKVIVGFLLSIAGIIFVLFISYDKSVVLWKDFFHYLGDVERGMAFRNNSIYSFCYNLSKVIFGDNLYLLGISSKILVLIITFSLVIWIFIRIYTRIKQTGKASSDVFVDNWMDSIFLMFFLSPSVWDHHLVVAIPVVIWAVARYPDKLIGLVGISTALLFFVPTYDIFIFSYIRLLGLILLLAATPISRNYDVCRNKEEIDIFVPLQIT